VGGTRGRESKRGAGALLYPTLVRFPTNFLAGAGRVCRQVLGVYAGRQWSFIEEHLHEVLGRTAREGGNLDAALAHYGAMLACGGAPPAWQAQRLRTFLDTVQQAALQQVPFSPSVSLSFPTY